MEQSSALPFDEANLPPTGRNVSRPEGLWTEDMAQRLKVLYHAQPIFALHRSAAHGTETADYDVVVLAFKLLDLLAEEAGLGDGISADEATGNLLPLLEIMDREAGRQPDQDRHRRVAQKVLDFLLNRGGSSRQFEIEYLSSLRSDGTAETAVLKFRLVAEVHSPRGVVLRLTPEAVNLIFRMLAVDLESSMAATEAILEHLLKRGRFDEALRSARQALKQAGAYRLKIQAFRQNVRSDIQMEMGSEALLEAMAFIQERQEEDKVLLAQINARREDLRENGARQEEIESRYQSLAEIHELITQCAGIFASLGYDIMEAHREFTMEHGRQCLRARPRTQHFPNLMTDKAPAVFLAPLASVEGGLLAFHQRLVGYMPPERFSFAHLMGPLKRALTTDNPDKAFDEEQVEQIAHKPPISDEDWAWVQNFLAGVSQKSRLSDLLATVAQEDAIDGPRRLGVVIEVIRAFAFGSDKPGVLLKVEVSGPNRPLRWQDLEFYGDDLWVEPFIEEESAAVEEGA